ncbi:hypothetical protein P6P35_00780 [Clostridium perfringens]|nr:hypothetical protein [Clostridium perfringens]
MGWISTTRWQDNEDKNINSVIDKLTNIKFENNETSNITYQNFESSKRFDENKKYTINNKDYEYNYITYSFDTITLGEGTIYERTQSINGFIIVYFDGDNINYIINRNYDAMKILRMLLGYNKNLKIVQNNITFDEDLFMWFIKKVFEEENTFDISQDDNSEKELTINSIIGVRGESKDLVNRLSAQGNTVMNLISTLSFILESGNLKQIILRLEYKNHENLEIRLNDKKVISVDVDSYSGIYEDNIPREDMIAKIMLLTYSEIIPKLIQFYKVDVDDGEWDDDKKTEFYEIVAEKLLSKIQEQKPKK